MHFPRHKHFPSSFFQIQRKYLINLLQNPHTTSKLLKHVHAWLFFKNPSPHTSLYLYNSLLLAYANSFYPSYAFSVFASQMRQFDPDKFTYQFLLKASSKSKSIIHSSQIHLMVLKLGFICYNSLMNAIMSCYVLCDRLTSARNLFDEMPLRDVVSFNTMIHGYAEAGHMGSAFQIFKQVHDPNVVTWTAMIAGFAGNRDVLAARWVFEEMPSRDLVSWNAIISCYIQNQKPIEALQLFHRMQAESFKPNRVTLVSVLSACASAGALDTGKWIHVFIQKNKCMLDSFLGSALIDMYVKCGVPQIALEVFACLKEKNTCTWNALINGLAMNGKAEQALEMFHRMRKDRSIRPDEVTFVGVLLACSHGGFIEEGRRHFHCTVKEYGVNLVLEHYSCMVDLLGRCGMLEEAAEIIRSMPIMPDVVVWRALLGACRLHKDVVLAEKVVSEMEAHSSGDYVLLSNLYASAGRWSDVEKMRNIMKYEGIKKVPGSSLIEVNNTIHEFISRDKSYHRYADICKELEELTGQIRKEGN